MHIFHPNSLLNQQENSLLPILHNQRIYSFLDVDFWLILFLFLIVLFVAKEGWLQLLLPYLSFSIHLHLRGILACWHLASFSSSIGTPSMPCRLRYLGAFFFLIPGSPSILMTCSFLYNVTSLLAFLYGYLINITILRTWSNVEGSAFFPSFTSTRPFSVILNHFPSPFVIRGLTCRSYSPSPGVAIFLIVPLDFTAIV